jgi:hypothetical protein
MTTPRDHAYRRIKQKQDATALQQKLARFDPEYIAKLQHDALVAANAELRGSDATVIVRAAQERFEAYIKFLTEKQA